jgi:Brp/Blh family beta-carotene 15,15'-monooxygenase
MTGMARVTRHPETFLFLSAVVLALLAAALGAQPGPAMLIGAAALAAAAGLPHGALDPLAARQAGLADTALARAAFLAGYTGLAALVVIAWLIAPVAALAVFILVSAWHFGGDWFDETAALVRLGLGLSLLSLPSVLHGDVVGGIYAVLSGEPAVNLAVYQARLAPVWIAGVGVAGLLAARRSRRLSVEIAATGLAALVLHPLLFFALYFALLHSARHFLGLWHAAPDRRIFVRTGVFYTAISLAGAGLAFGVLGRTGEMDETVLRIAFIGLAALTAPHMALIEWIRRRGEVLPRA